MATATKVLVVDDSLTMRALISGALERIPNVEVVGLADGADEARALTATLKPHVITLDVEMPGMSGIEYLAEVMAERPMPVIMFSTRTEAGAEASVEALRLGAIDCFPKPKVATPAELDKIIVKLGKRIKQARTVDVQAPAPAARPAAAAALDWNGRPLAIGADASNTKALFDLFATFPANCPPTLVVQHLGAGLVDSMAAKLAGEVAPRVVVAEDGMAVEQGTIYLAPSGDRHLVLDGWPNGRLRLLARDAVAGERPSISVLFASMAKASGADTVALLLSPAGEDGAAGANALSAVGGYLVKAAEAPGGYTLNRRMVSQPVGARELPAAVLKLFQR
jgi:two-component system chemotaxis response regulator CheB